MKSLRIISFIFLNIFSFILASCGDTQNKNCKTVIHLPQSQKHLNEVKFGSHISFEIVIENKGDCDFHLLDARTDCDCYKTIFPKEMIIKSFDSGKINVSFKPEYIGKFTNTITIFGNLKESPVIYTFDGIVLQ